MCFGSKSGGDDTTTTPPARRTEVKNPDMFRTPTFDQGREPGHDDGRRGSYASGHSPSQSIREDKTRDASAAGCPGRDGKEKPTRTTDEVTESMEPAGAVIATDIGAGTAAPEIQGMGSVGRTGGDGIVR
jgi:hypothetical protein